MDKMREHAFVTSQGLAYTRFRRALDRGKVTEALSAASELEHVGLAEALELCLLLRGKATERYRQAALGSRAKPEGELDEAPRAVGDCLPLIAHKTKPRGTGPRGSRHLPGLLPGPRLWLCRQRSGNSSSAIASSPPHGPSALMTVRGERPGHRYFAPTTAHTYTSSVSTSVISPAAAAARTSSSDRNWWGANPALKTIRT
jgi:hypothetical protein